MTKCPQQGSGFKRCVAVRLSTISRAIVSLAVASVAFGCGGTSAPTFPDGSKVTVMLLLNNGIKDNADDTVKTDQAMLGDRLDNDIAARLNEGGFVAQKIQAKTEFSPAKNLFLAVTDIDEYQSSDVYFQEARRLGDGVTVELFKDNHTLPTMRRTRGFVCTRDWTYCTDELTRTLAKEISGRINEFY